MRWFSIVKCNQARRGKAVAEVATLRAVISLVRVGATIASLLLYSQPDALVLKLQCFRFSGQRPVIFLAQPAGPVGLGLIALPT